MLRPVTMMLHTGRRSAAMRLRFAALYLVLGLGSMAMVYPFLLMLAGSAHSHVDTHEMTPIPRFLYDDTALYRKHIEGLFNESIRLHNQVYDRDDGSFEQIEPPGQPNERLACLWLQFLRETPRPPQAAECGYLFTPLSRTLPHTLRAFRRTMEARYDNRIDALNNALGMDFNGWNSFFVLPHNYMDRVNQLAPTPFLDAYNTFKTAQPPDATYVFSAQGYFRQGFLRARHGEPPADARLTPRAPEGPVEARRDWEDFVRLALNRLWIRIDPDATPAWHGYLQAKYADLGALNEAHGSDWTNWAVIEMPSSKPSRGATLADWDAFIAGWTDPDTGVLHQAPLERLRIEAVDFAFTDWLRARYRTIERLNDETGASFAAFEAVPLPQREAHALAFRRARADLRREFLTRNYRAVWDYIVVHGRGLLNTAIYCGLSVLCALIVNPLAAYALSRGKPRSRYGILLFLLLTMAFPPMITQIPVFLMLREMNLLNSFAALVLPTLANGFSIFLLKGFFDSLPRELYETAELEGASEWRMFWSLTMRLSAPILAVVALQAFIVAYENFMFALLICQDEKMWTLMVWLYQLQQRSGPAVMYASLIVAAIPTLLIFLFCQRVILRGIVIPVER